LHQERFINKYSSSWHALENTVKFLDKKDMSKLEPKNIREFLYLFRRTSHHLAYARTHFPNSDVTSYLNALVGRAHNHIYAVKKSDISKILYYIRYGFSKKCKEFRSYIVIAFIIFLIGASLSMIMVNTSPQNASYFMPQKMIDNIDYNMDTSSHWDYPLMSSYIMINNISVSIKAFVYGITLGLGTIYILFSNGALLGALSGLVYHFGTPLKYWSLILPHGIIELTAIFISGGAGLIIARSILIPKEYSRKHSIIKASKEAVSLLLGVAMLLVIAGVIEGFFTPLNISPTIKLIFATFTLVALIIYFAIPYIKSDV